MQLALSNQTLIMPISIAKMNSRQSVANIVASLCKKGTLASLVESPTNDVDLVMTSGLYHNNLPETFEAVPGHRMGLLQREGLWRRGFEKAMEAALKNGDKVGDHPLIPSACAFVDWNQQLTGHWPDFESLYAKIQDIYKRRPGFQEELYKDIRAGGRIVNEFTRRFMFEEIALMALWMRVGTGVSPRIRGGGKENGIYIAYPGKPPVSLISGVDLLSRGKRDILPLTWINHEDGLEIHSFRFGSDTGVRSPSYKPSIN